MRVALVSPYSWTYPGGVTRHIEALAEHLLEDGHEVRVLAPYDPDDRRSAALHRGARPQPRVAPDYLLPLGRTIGFPANGAVSNLSITPYGLATMQRELRTGGYDVVHIHEPVAPILGWVGADSIRLPLVGTFHAFSENRVSNGIANAIGARRVLNRLHVRIAVSEAAAWTGRRWFGGHYRVIPNGVAIPERVAVKQPGRELRLAFVGQAVERKGLPVLLRAFEALREHIPVSLTIVGATGEELAPLLLDDRGITALGKVDDEHKRRVLEEADLLVAPSLGGESFGMVLTEAFAAGTPVVASDIAGYRDVVRDGIDGRLVPRGDASALAQTLHDLYHEPAQRLAMGAAAAEHAQRYAWPRVTAEIAEAYEDAIATPQPEGRAARAAVLVGARSADLKERIPARRLPSLTPPLAGQRRPAVAFARRAAVLAAGAGAVGLGALALERIGLDKIAGALINSSPTYVLLGVALMCAAMMLRAVSWHASLRAALPRARLRLLDAMQGTFIGVLMSATLPARLGEPSRALIVARRSGRPRANLPVVLGTIVSQTVVNVVALVILGAVMFRSVGIFHGHESGLIVASVAPLALLAAVLLMPALLRGESSRFRRLRGLLAQLRSATTQIRSGLAVFRDPKLGATTTLFQLGAWALQWVSCYVLLIALGLDHRAGIGAAAAVLFAVNVTAVLPATPSNLGVFQAACVAVLSGAYGIGSADALAYGIILQAVEVATAIVMGMPALVKEGTSWREVRLRAMHTAPVQLVARSATPEAAEGAAEAGGQAAA